MLMKKRPIMSAVPKSLAATALIPIFVFGSVFNALPALAQMETISRPALAGDSVSAAASSIASPLAAAPSLTALAAPLSAPAAAPALSAPAAALTAAAPAAVSASAVEPSAMPAAAASAAAPAARVPGSATEVAQAFHSFVNSLAAVHPGLRAALGASRMFDGAAARPDAAATAAASFGILPRSKGVSLQRSRAAAPAAAPAQGVALDADPTDPASIEKALRAYVDAHAAQFGAPSSQMAKVSVSILPSILPGQGTSILAVFRQALTGTDKDGTPYELSVSGKSLAFHIKVFKNGTPVLMNTSGAFASGVTSDVMAVSYDDAELESIAAKRALSPADSLSSAGARRGKSAAPRTNVARAKGKSAPKSKPKASPRAKPAPRRGKTRPRGGDKASGNSAPAAEDEPAAPKFLTRQLTDELGGQWRTINIYQATDPQGQPLIVIVDVKTGEAFAFNPQNLQSGMGSGRRHLISGTVTGRGTTATPDGGDHGPIGPIALPLTNVYDQKGNVVAVTDENGNFSIPGSGTTPVKLTIRLASPLVPFVRDEDAQKNGPVEVTVMAVPGQPLNVTLNPVSANPELAANIVGYVGYLRHHIWVKGLPGIDAARMDIPLAGGIVVNGHEEQGNAFYDPSNDSVNLMAAAVIAVRDAQGRPQKLQVENTAAWSIEDHEDTHRVVQIYSQIQLTPEQKASPVYRFVKWSMEAIMGSDVNESIADVVSYFMRDSSTIGDGFYGNPPPGQPGYIRSALDKTTYDPNNPDPHNGVLAQSMWAARQAFIAALGAPAGTAYANAMIPLMLIAQPLTPIDALFHMVLWDLREDGSSPFGDLIRRIAQGDHGIALPATPVVPTPQA